MADLVVFETNPEILAEIGELLSQDGLLERAELHLVLPGTPIENVLARTRPKLVVTSWRNIGRRVVEAAHALDPRPAVWVMSNYPPEGIRDETPLPVDNILVKFSALHRDFPRAVQAFLEGAGRPE